jgi:hypothetical protein
VELNETGTSRKPGQGDLVPFVREVVPRSKSPSHVVVVDSYFE